jgi:hypothetical protein
MFLILILATLAGSVVVVVVVVHLVDCHFLVPFIDLLLLGLQGLSVCASKWRRRWQIFLSLYQALIPGALPGSMVRWLAGIHCVKTTGLIEHDVNGVLVPRLF